MKEIKLNRGFITLVDDADYTSVSRHKWYAVRHRNSIYAQRSDGVLLHRFLMPGICRVDHRDGYGLNNRRVNLRACTNTQNLCNRGPQQNNTSGFKGVYWNKINCKWVAQIRLNGPTKYLGSFTDPVLAAKAYDKAARELHGEFARLNFL